MINVEETLLVSQLVKRLAEFDALLMTCDTNVIEARFDGLKLSFKTVEERTRLTDIIEDLEAEKRSLESDLFDAENECIRLKNLLAVANEKAKLTA